MAARLARLGNRLRLDARLVDGTGSRVLRRLPPEDHPLEALSLQQGVVEAVADLLELKVAPGERHVLQQGNTAVGGAYALYLQARGHLQRFERAENLENALSLLQKALEQDPGYALAYAALGEAYWRLYELQKRPELVTLAQDNCRKAIGLNDLLAPVHVTLGHDPPRHGQGRGGARGPAARARPRPAQRGSVPGDRAGSSSRSAGRRRRSRRSGTRRSCGPRTGRCTTTSGALYLATNRLAEAEVEFRRVIALAPDNPRGYTNVGAVCFRQGRLEEAEGVFRRSVAIRSTAPRALEPRDDALLPGPLRGGRAARSRAP